MNRKTSIVALLILAVIFSSATIFQVELAKADGSPYFSDHFDGGLVDPLKWAMQENSQMSGYPAYGGSISLADSNIILSSNGSSFPYVPPFRILFQVKATFASSLT